MIQQVVYVFLGTRTEDAAVALDPITYEGIDDWEQIGEVHTMTELEDLLSKEPFDPAYWDLLLEEMDQEIYKILT